MIYLVLFQSPNPDGSTSIRAHGTTFSNVEAAEIVIKEYTDVVRVKTWLYGVQRPPLVELVKDMPG